MFLKDALRPADLGLILSYRCQCACAHCIYNCGNTWQDWMSSADVRRHLINQTDFSDSSELQPTHFYDSF